MCPGNITSAVAQRSCFGHTRLEAALWIAHKGCPQAGQILAVVMEGAWSPSDETGPLALLPPHMLLFHSRGQSPVSSCWEDGDRDQPPCLPSGSGYCPWCGVCTELLSGQETPFLGISIYTQQVAGGVVDFSWVAGLRCQQHQRAGAGVAGQGTFHGCYCHSTKWQMWRGVGASLGCSLAQCYRACCPPQCRAMGTCWGHFATCPV